MYKDFSPKDTHEWGRMTLADLMQYEYRDRQKNEHSTTMAETIEANPNEKGKSIMILGCGYSKLGEEMAEQGWQKIIQVDMVSKVINDMSERCQPWIEQGVMDCIEDEGTTLSAFDAKTMHAVFDKGLVDTLFLGDQHKHVGQIMESVHRVLQPNGVFCILSLSDPTYLLPTLLPETALQHSLWEPVQVRELSNSFLYRCKKVRSTKTQQGDHVRSRKKFRR